MKFMILVKSNPDLEARLAAMSDSQMKEQMAAMGVFNEELKKAGVMKDCDGLRPSREGKRVSLRRQHTHCRRRAFCGRSRCRLLALGAAIRRRGGCVGQAMPKPDARTVGDRDQANLVAANRRAERASRRDAMSGARGCPLDGRVRRLLLEARRRAESGRHAPSAGLASIDWNEDSAHP